MRFLALTLLTLTLYIGCDSGQATVSCVNGASSCGKYCADLEADTKNCGTCGTVCSEAQVCIAGACGCPEAKPTLCSSSAGTGGSAGGGGSCADLTSDSANCGACGAACPTGTSCSKGACVCSGSQTLCGTTCADTAHDTANCGKCGNACGGGAACVDGACGCPGTLTLCGGACVDTTANSANCGGCGMPCTASQVCVAGQCASDCPPTAPALCGSGATAYCADTTTDAANCGACANACPTFAACTGSACACPSGDTVCGASTGVPGACGAAGQCLNGALPTDCAQLRLLAPSLPSGAYNIDPDGASGPIAPFPVYCDMVSDGGGWTLALKADGTANNPNASRFEYTTTVWTAASASDPNYTFNTASPDVITRESAKYMSFNTLPYTQVRLGMTDTPGPQSINYVQFSLPGAAAYGAGTAGKVTQSSLQATFAGGTQITIGEPGIPADDGLGVPDAGYVAQSGPPAGAGTPTQFEWTHLVSGVSLQPNCNFSGINASPAGTSSVQTRIGFLGSAGTDCTAPGSYIGLGNGGPTCTDTTYVGSGGCAANGDAGALGTVSPVGTFAYLWVRNNDFRNVVPAEASCAAHLAAGHNIPGIYSIAYGNVAFPVYCDMTHDGGGWTMVYKFSSGLPQTDDAAAIWSGAPANESVPSQLSVMSAPSAPTGPYLSRIVSTDWNTANGFLATYARVVVYNGEEEAKSLEFTIPKASATNITTWFNNGYLTPISGTDGGTPPPQPWTDVTVTGTYNFFSIQGDTANGGGRRWHINKSYNGCPADMGWLTVTYGATEGCGWEKQWSTSPPISTNVAAGALILYANQQTVATWQTASPAGVALATAMAVYVK